MTDHIWERHVFVCTGGDWCASVDGDGLGLHARLKKLVAQNGLKGRIRVNHAGCLDQCGYGPLVVVYPEAVWYWGVTPDDAEEIVREHLIAGRPVERLRYRNTPGKHKLPRDEAGRPIGRPARPASPLASESAQSAQADFAAERHPGAIAIASPPTGTDSPAKSLPERKPA